MTSLHSKKLKFFIVDDDAFSRMLYNQQLVNLGYKNNILLDNGVDCIDKLDLKPDVIFLDYGMAPINGIEVLKKVKQENPGINILFISGNKEMQIVNEALNGGAFDYIFKGDHDLDQIKRAVKRMEALMDAPGKPGATA
jgi:CheY-like chemotaxis protein